MRRPIAFAAAVIALAAAAAPARADVANRSDHAIFPTPEAGDPAPIRVGAGATYRGEQDGIMDPALPGGKVFKLVDGVDAVVHDDGAIATHALDPVGALAQQLLGGAIDPPVDWVDFERKARLAAANEPACRAAARRTGGKRGISGSGLQRLRACESIGSRAPREGIVAEGKEEEVLQLEKVAGPPTTPPSVARPSEAPREIDSQALSAGARAAPPGPGARRRAGAARRGSRR